MKIGEDENDKIVSMLNASANEITITANRLSIASDYFTLTKNGNVTATGGTIGGFTLSGTSLTANGVGLSTGEYAFWAGADNAANALFRVKNNNVIGAFFPTSTFVEVGGEYLFIGATDSDKTTPKGWYFNNSFFGYQTKGGTARIAECISEENAVPQFKFNSNIANSSDRNLKNSIAYLAENGGEKADYIFDSLMPATFKFDGEIGSKTHYGFIAQDIKAIIENAGLSLTDFAAYTEWEITKDGKPYQTCGLFYSEFIALCVDQIQKLKKRVETLEKEKQP